MTKQLTINDLYAVKEDRFKQTKTYQTKAPVDSRWYLIETPSNKEVRFTDVIDSEEVNLKPQPFIILADNERIELKGEVIKQEHIVDTDEVFDDVVKNVVPEVDYTGNITRYREEYNTKSHYEQQDYMRYTISYLFPISQLKVIASASKVECMLYDRELAPETCKVIQGGVKTVCYLLGDQNYEKDLETIIDVQNKKEADRQKKEREEKALKQKQQKAAQADADAREKRRTIGALLFFLGWPIAIAGMCFTDAEGGFLICGVIVSVVGMILSNQ